MSEERGQEYHKFIKLVLSKMKAADGGPVLDDADFYFATEAMKAIPPAQVDPVCTQLQSLISRFEGQKASKSAEQLWLLMFFGLSAEAFHKQASEAKLPPERLKAIAKSAEKASLGARLEPPTAGGVGLRRGPRR